MKRNDTLEFDWEMLFPRMAMHPVGFLRELQSSGTCRCKVEDEQEFARGWLDDDPYADAESIERHITNWMLPKLLVEAFESLSVPPDTDDAHGEIEQAVERALGRALHSRGLKLTHFSISRLTR